MAELAPWPGHPIGAIRGQEGKARGGRGARSNPSMESPTNSPSGEGDRREAAGGHCPPRVQPAPWKTWLPCSRWSTRGTASQSTCRARADRRATTGRWSRVIGLPPSIPLLAAEGLAFDGTLIGYSLGGRVALSWWAREPERFSRVVLMAPDGLVKNPGYRFAVDTLP